MTVLVWLNLCHSLCRHHARVKIANTSLTIFGEISVSQVSLLSCMAWYKRCTCLTMGKVLVDSRKYVNVLMIQTLSFDANSAKKQFQSKLLEVLTRLACRRRTQ